MHCVNCVLNTLPFLCVCVCVCRFAVADATNVYYRMDYGCVCVRLLLELVCVLYAEAADKTPYSTEGAHGSCAVCHCAPRRWVHVLCADDPGSHSVWTVRCLSALSLVRWLQLPRNSGDHIVWACLSYSSLVNWITRKVADKFLNCVLRDKSCGDSIGWSLD